MRKSNENDPLKSLLVGDIKNIDRQRLANLVGPFVAIDQNTRELGFHEKFQELSKNSSKVEIILSAAKARALLFDQPDGMTQKEIVDLGVIPEGSAKSTIFRLVRSYKIKKDSEDRYFIPNHRISSLMEEYNTTS